MDDALKQELERLRKENAALKEQLHKKPDPDTQEKIRLAVATRIIELMPDAARFTKQSYKRRLTDDLKWNLRVRYAKDFSEDHLKAALEYIQNWKPESMDSSDTATGTEGGV